MFFLYIPVTGSGCDIVWSLMSLKESVTMYDDCVFDPLHPLEEDIRKLEQFVLSHNFDCLISYLFIPEVSDLCEKYHLKYIGWVYDSPLITLFHPSARNSCNYLFIFDRAEYEHLSAYSIPHLYYLPMATNTSRTGMINIEDNDEQHFACDVSFVGSLYEDNMYNSIIQSLPEDIASELKLYLLRNICNWSKPKPWPRLSEKATNYLIDNFHAEKWQHMEMELDLFLGILLLSRKLSEVDRITVLNTLAEQYSVHLYTYRTSSFLSNVHVHPSINYDTDMNKLFYLSKINLNITLPSIVTGLPQRIFDIMGCGGFVLTNYQEELDDHFIIGEDLETFHNLDELKEKTAYYLCHEKERIRIAMNGYQKVCSHFSYIDQMKQILKIVKEDSE